MTLQLGLLGLVILVILATVVPTLSFDIPEIGLSWSPPAAATSSQSDALRTGVITSARVAKVTDGDTIHVEFDDGTVEKVRLIGIDTPESTNEIEPWGKEASSFTARAVPVGTRIWVEPDIDLRDRYGRLLAYVWIENPASRSEDYVRKHMLNAQIAASGFAEPLTIQPNSKYAPMIARLVAQAARSELGMWSSDAPANP